MAYVRLPGTPMVKLHHRDRSDHAVPVAGRLGEFRTAFRAVPAASMADLVDVDDQRLGEWRREEAAAYPTVAGRTGYIDKSLGMEWLFPG